jgi:hypothetical protein
VTTREDRAARWPTGVYLNLYQINALLAAVESSRGTRGLLGGYRDKHLGRAVQKLTRAADRRRQAVARAGGRG